LASLWQITIKNTLTFFGTEEVIVFFCSLFQETADEQRGREVEGRAEGVVEHRDGVVHWRQVLDGRHSVRERRLRWCAVSGHPLMTSQIFGNFKIYITFKSWLEKNFKNNLFGSRKFILYPFLFKLTQIRVSSTSFFWIYSSKMSMGNLLPFNCQFYK